MVNADVPKVKPLPRFGYGFGGGNGGGVSMAAGLLYGNGSPEGVVTGSPGNIYTRLDTGGFWNKITGEGTTTGWNELIA
jgi:hypothetical protein